MTFALNDFEINVFESNTVKKSSIILKKTENSFKIVYNTYG